MSIKFVLVFSVFDFLGSFHSGQNKSRVTEWEIAFVLFAAGFTLEEYTASTEHGWRSKLIQFTESNIPIY